MVTEKEQEKVDEVAAEEVEVNILKSENEALTREVQSREAAITRLEQSLAARNGEIADLQKALEEARQALDELGKALPQAVAAYKELIVQTNPGIVAELITGDTIGEVNESLKNARSLMERVRQEMEAEIAKMRVPAGAPQRARLDLSGLSPREKIQYAIGGGK
jgi:chromosome segregation ATPase